MRYFLALAGAMAVAALGVQGAAEAAAVGQQQPTGLWRNPKNSVHIRIQPCGGNVCGTVVWANARAQEKARKAGTPSLIGRQLLQEFRPEGPGAWGGRVFVPDMARTVSGKLTKAGPNSVVASGCLLGRMVCKSQTWTRIG
jgi:uncharacterized protein (DUF2147 family)